LPSPEVAVRLALALDEDPDLFESWAIARARGSLDDVLAAAGKVARMLGRPAIADRRHGGGETGPATDPTAGSTTHESPQHSASTPAHRIPLLAEGADPAKSPAAIEWLDLAASLLPPGSEPGGLFAYRLTAHGVRRVPESVRTGDCVVLVRCDDLTVADGIHAVRFGPRVELARVALDGDQAVLIESGSRSPLPAAPRDVIAGRMVVAIRRWL
jgi:hypothetical protein